MKWFMKLPTGQFSELDGCAIVAIPDDTPDHMVDEVVSEQDGYYCFTSQPTELEPNNGQTLEDLKRLGIPDWVDCIGCGRKFNLNNWMEDMAYTNHNCESNVDLP
jgi:hypothetical protein